jgi:hypothetical protein
MNQVSEKRYAAIAINNNENLISEPTHVAKLFNAYFTEIAERLQCTFTPRYLNIPTVIKTFCLKIFSPTNDDLTTTINKDLKNKKSNGLDGF